MHGPPAVLYFISSETDKEHYMGMIQTYFVITNAMMTIVRAGNGYLTADVGGKYIVGITGVVLGSFAGSWLFDKIPGKIFPYIVYSYIGISGIIILMVSPIKALIFVVFILLLQQVDGNIIGPRILGSSVGINGFWVMFSIILGAGLFGFWGMLLGVPVFVVIYSMVNSAIEKRLKKRDLPWEVTDYVDMEHIDPITHQPVKKNQE